MAYTRQNVTDGVTIMNKDLYDNLQDGIDENKKELSTLGGTVEIGSEAPKEKTVLTIDPNGEEFNIYTAEEVDDMLQSQSVKCSEVGMTTNDINGNNFTLLCEAISKSDKIIVDGFYKLSASEPYEINKNIAIIGMTPDCGFEVTNIDYAFNFGDSCHQFELDNLTFENTSDIATILFSKENYTKQRMNFVRMNGCHLVGHISPIRLIQSPDINPEEVDIGVDVISITNNTSIANKTTCFIFTNVSYNLLEVAGNVIRNMKNIFVNSGTTNESVYVNEIAKNMKFAHIHHNDVYNDDTCFRSESAIGTYYVFVLIEGNKVHYHHNRVEGMKANSYVALYDAYLSCAEVISEYNYWKNNCVFDNECPSNVLMKSKGNGGFVDVGTRRYHNNTYITEKSFYEKFGALGKGYVRIVDNVSPNTYDLQGNHFDLYRAEGFSASSVVYGFIFKNNTFKVEEWLRGHFCAGVEGAEVIFEGNEITLTNISQQAGILLTGDFFAKKLTITNNVLRNVRYVIGSSKAEELIFRDNYIYSDLADNIMLSSYGRFKKVESYGNKIEVTRGNLHPFSGYVYEDIDYEIESTIYNRVKEGAILRFDKESQALSDNRIFTVEIEGYLYRESVNKYFKGQFSLVVTGENAKIVDTNGETIITNLYYNSTSKKNYSLGVTMLSGDKLPFDILFVLKDGVENSSAVVLTGNSNAKINFKTHITSTKIDYTYVSTDVTLPSGYTRLHYLETDGNQFVDTEVIASDYPNGIRYVFKGNITEKSRVNGEVSGNDYLFGAYYGGVRVCNAYFAPQTDTEERRFGIMSGTNATRIFCTSDYPLLGTDFILDVTCGSNNLGSAVATLNGVPMTGETGFANGAMPKVSIHLFACNGQGLPYYSGKSYEFSMYNPTDGSLIANFIPVIRDSDGVVGMFETVKGKLHTNKGTGKFKTPNSYKGNLTEKDIDYIMSKVFEQIEDGSEVAY